MFLLLFLFVDRRIRIHYLTTYGSGPGRPKTYGSFGSGSATLLIILFDVIRYVQKWCGSGIPDPTFFHSGSRIRLFFHPGSRIRIKEFKYFNPKKWFLSSSKYDPGCSSRIRISTFYPSRIPEPWVKKVPDPGSGSATLNCAGKSW
jgi:hypothetical protein